MPQLGLMFIVLTYFVIVGTSNAVNLTDGLDGLAIMPTVMVAGASPSSPGPPATSISPTTCIFLCTLYLRAGDRLYRHRRGGSGFPLVQHLSGPGVHGDVGSLALGGALGTIAVLVRQEFLLVIMGGVFVMETVSVILQVGSYKLRGVRIFRMAPIHHHYEKKGWPEPRVIVRFWIITLMLVLLGLATLKVR